MPEKTKIRSEKIILQPACLEQILKIIKIDKEKNAEIINQLIKKDAGHLTVKLHILIFSVFL